MENQSPFTDLTHTPKLFMDVDEIVTLYKQSRDKSHQVKVLSELNSCDPDYIIEILKANGISPQSLPRRKHKVKTLQASDAETTIARNVQVTTPADTETTVATESTEASEVKHEEPQSMSEIERVVVNGVPIKMYDYIQRLQKERSALMVKVKEIDKKLNAIRSACAVPIYPEVDANEDNNK